MKINFKNKSKVDYSQSTDTTNSPPNTSSGHNYLSPIRFRNIWELRAKYNLVKSIRGTGQAFANIIRQYERQPYSVGGRILPNFGTLRGKVDKAMSTYIDFCTERERWGAVETDYGEEDGLQKMFSEHISAAFHKYCIKRWGKAFSDNLLAVRDMLLMSKGAMVFDVDDSAYPSRTSIQHIYPDSNASMFPDSFDTLFIHRRIRAVDLFKMIKDEEAAKISGWNRDAVLMLLRSSQATWKSMDLDSLFIKFGSGAILQSQQDAMIDLAYAFVTEYHPEENGNVISQFIFPVLRTVNEAGASQLTDKNIAEVDDKGYLLYKLGAKKKMSQVIALIAHTVCENYWEDPSLAQLMYTMSKTYDMVMNRVLDGIEDNMRVYLKSDSPETMSKIQRMRHGNWQVLSPGVSLVQDRINRPINESLVVLNKLMVDTNASFGDYTVGEQTSTSTPKTARQSEIDYSESKTVSTGMIKTYNCYHDLLITEIYNRFIDLGSSNMLNDEEQRNFKKFASYLERKKVPKAAYQKDQVQVSSIALAGAGSTQSKIQALQMVQGALSIAAGTPGENLVKRGLIGAAVGVSNIDAYLPTDDTMMIGEDSLIGLENDALSVADCNPTNVPVINNQLHMRHIPVHLQDASLSMQTAGKIFQALGGMPKDDAGIYLVKIQDILIGIDNKLAHTQAHMQIASKDKNPKVQAALSQAGQHLQVIQHAQDGLEKAIAQAQKARADKQNQQGDQMQPSPEMQHAAAMFQMKEQHAQRMLDFEFQNAGAKAAQLRQQSGENALHKQALETVLTQNDLRTKQLESSIKLSVAAQKAAIDLKKVNRSVK